MPIFIVYSWVRGVTKLISIELNQKFKVKVFFFFFFFCRSQNKIKKKIIYNFFLGGPGQGVHLNP